MEQPKLTINDLDAFPELRGDKFPFNGYRDFRGMPDEVYAAFAAGVFKRVDNSMFLAEVEADPLRYYNCKWLGGRDRFPKALERLIACGFECICTPPKSAHDHWYRIRFKA